MKTKLIIFLVLVALFINNLNARYYNPKIGRFITADSITPDGGANLEGLNRYSYCYNNPVKYTDPTGNEPESVFMESVYNPLKNSLNNDLTFNLTDLPFGAGMNYNDAELDSADLFLEYYRSILHLDSTKSSKAEARLYFNNTGKKYEFEYFRIKAFDLLKIGSLSISEMEGKYNFQKGNASLLWKTSLNLYKLKIQSELSKIDLGLDLYGEPSYNISSEKGMEFSKLKSGADIKGNLTIGSFTAKLKIGLYGIYDSKGKITPNDRLDLTLSYKDKELLEKYPGLALLPDKIRAKFDFTTSDTKLRDVHYNSKITAELHWDLNKKK